jgi:diguanylate cyclase (GGDEF)-like protein
VRSAIADLLHQVRDGVGVVDEHGVLVGWSDPAAELTGWSTETAARRIGGLHEGLTDLGDDRWIDVRWSDLPDGRRAAVLTDARHQVALREAHARLNEVSTTDPLTSLPNRVLAEDRLRLSVALARRDRRRIAVLFVDLDRFKLVNDTLGHHVGDELLKQVAARLRSSVRESDTVARVGGDEFVVLLHSMDGPDTAEVIGRSILAGMGRSFALGEHEVYLACSVGLAVFPDHGETPAALLQHADLAMFRAKAEGGNSMRPYAPVMSELTRERVAISAELHRALERDELELRYQPQVDLASGALAGVEALVRWRHPDRGLLSPDRFLSVAEEDGSIVDIDRWVLNTACRQGRAWLDEGHDIPMLAVNLSARTLCSSDVVGMVAEALAVSGLPASLLELEVSEHVVAGSVGEVEPKLADLKALGVQLAIDDFGTGYSSLGYLKRFPLDTIKLDRSFVSDVTDQPDRADIAILRAVVAMAGDLGLRCVAEGVETQGQRSLLGILDCGVVQGYLYSKPLPAAEFEAALLSLAVPSR